MDLRWTAVKNDKEKGRKWSEVSRDALIYVATTERVSKYDKTAAREDSGCRGGHEDDPLREQISRPRDGVRFALSQ
jgi:hypothetical protein